MRMQERLMPRRTVGDRVKERPRLLSGFPVEKVRPQVVALGCNPVHHWPHDQMNTKLDEYQTRCYRNHLRGWFL